MCIKFFCMVLLVFLVSCGGGGGEVSPAQSEPIGKDENTSILFPASDASFGLELWKSDGTALGTTLVKDININGNSSFAFSGGGFLRVGDLTYFIANDGDSTELWVSDGSEMGTQIVNKINSNGSSLIGSGLVRFKDKIYFSATNGIAGQELWSTTGAAGNAALVANINKTSSQGSFPRRFTVASGVLYFIADDGTGDCLWKTDGTDSGTVKVKDDNNENIVDPSEIVSASNKLFFIAEDQNDIGSGKELFVIDQDGARRVSELNGNSSNHIQSQLEPVGENIFFVSNANSASGEELWLSDGTSVGTYMVKDIVSGPQGADITALFSFEGEVYFSALPPAGRSLWKSDGTSLGTVEVKSVETIIPTSAGPRTLELTPRGFFGLGGDLYFSGIDELGVEFWKTDGSTEGTMRVKDLRIGVDSSGIGYDSSPSELTARLYGSVLALDGGDVLLMATSSEGGAGALGVSLWRTDGSEDGTQLVKKY